ncbi:MAG: DUF1697 domain-containing protein [Calditrichaeota bacterium]|nr:DUF1697 domain-containing protein [Calditrichota bacterium]
MQTFISLLRGINVSGQKLIKMADLRELYFGLGFTDVQTYIQSGNVIFKTQQTDRKKIITKIENAINEKYGFHVPVQIRSQDEIKTVIDNLPIKGEREFNRLLVTFLSEIPETIPMDEIKKFMAPDDDIVIKDREIYFYFPEGLGKSKLDNKTLERKLNVKTTARNWKTVNKLYEMCVNQSS